jgi:hypothetical protein
MAQKLSEILTKAQKFLHENLSLHTTDKVLSQSAVSKNDKLLSDPVLQEQKPSQSIDELAALSYLAEIFSK